ncbi:glutathione S-transferase family protein [Thaumasiovibrio subtropicus]|uniref:glutathione S-transferase family protein n=1 Tax=Thaumasiovibrio subtropicus TaxID=1891207 RepID=UPI000B352BE9|nr:glutathione S-transferase family protein [Thaumasiovibrio subtropicus]
MDLYIANQNYSTWSLRAWLCLAQHNIDANIIKLTLFTDEFYQTLSSVSPAAKVPALVDGDVAVWDSLAIAEYLNETVLEGKGWPADRAQRAKARALAAEMHSGFFALRNEMPMNCRAIRNLTPSVDAQRDIARIDEIFQQQMRAFPDGWLFGEWSIADAMFAPVALRFKTYQVELSPLAKQYQEKVLNSAAIQRWLAEASLETDIVEEDEAGEPV